jgi:hypothetical protein
MKALGKLIAYVALLILAATLAAIVLLGLINQHRWSWLVIPTWLNSVASLGLLVGAVITAFYAQRTFANQATQLKDQQTFNEKQIEFNKNQLKILEKQSILAAAEDKRQRTPRFKSDILTINDGSGSLFLLHLRLLSDTAVKRIDAKLLDRPDGFPVPCPIGFTPIQWGVPRYAEDGSSPWDGPKRYQDASLRDSAWWPPNPERDLGVSPEAAKQLNVGGAAIWQIALFPDVTWPPFAHLRIVCHDETGTKWTLTVDLELPISIQVIDPELSATTDFCDRTTDVRRGSAT